MFVFLFFCSSLNLSFRKLGEVGLNPWWPRMELISRLSCREVARLLATFRIPQQLLPAAWHCAFAHTFRQATIKKRKTNIGWGKMWDVTQAYLRYFVGPLRKPAPLGGPLGTNGIQWLGGAPESPGSIWNRHISTWWCARWWLMDVDGRWCQLAAFHLQTPTGDETY